MNSDPDPKTKIPSHNAILIKPAKGAQSALQAIKKPLKDDCGCHYNFLAQAYSCPISNRIGIESLLASNNIKASLQLCVDDFFNKNEISQKAENLWISIDIAEQEYYKEENQLIVDIDRLENEITIRQYSEADPLVLECKKQIALRQEKQRERKEEIEQLRNSVALLEKHAENTVEATMADLVVEELNKKHAVLHADQFYILTEKPHNLLPGTDFVLESKQSFLNTYENQYALSPDGKTKKNKAKIWLSHPNRRQFDNGISFDPTTSGHRNGCYNIWKGFAVEARQGKCSLFREHIEKVICSGNKTYFSYLWNWMACLVQKPDTISTGIVLMSGQGTGKGIFVKALGRLFGHHFLHLDNLERLLGNFNFHMKNAVLVFGDEAIWGGNKKDIGKLKAMVTEEYAMIEAKGKDIIPVRNFRHFILSSNEEWPLHLDPDDRRFLILQVSEQHKEDFEYFNNITSELEHGGYEALLYDLLNTDISGFNPRALPKNIEAFDIKIQSAPSSERYIYCALLEENFDIGNQSSTETWPETKLIDSVFQDYRSWCILQGIRNDPKAKFGKALHKLICSIKKERPYVNGKRPEYYRFPSLANAREDFQKAFKVDARIWE